MYIGAIAKIDLGLEGFGIVEHSAVYLGNNRFAELHGSGVVRIVDSDNLLNSSKERVGNIIYLATNKLGFVLRNKKIALRALKEVNKRWRYNLLRNNCHEFTVGCIIGKFENNYNLLTLLEIIVSEKLNDGEDIIWREFNPKKLSLQEELWTDSFFESFVKFLKISKNGKKDIKTIFKKSKLSDVLKQADKNQKQFLKEYSEILKIHMKEL